MTQNRKAELQRRLSMTAVPKPPDDLAQRIKSAIPDPLPASKPARLGSRALFGMKVAASLVLLITSVALSLQLLSRGETPPSPPRVMASKDADASKPSLPALADTTDAVAALSNDAPQRQAAGDKRENAPGAPSLRARGVVVARISETSSQANEIDAGPKEKKGEERVEQAAASQVATAAAAERVGATGAVSPAAPVPASAPAAPPMARADSGAVAKTAESTATAPDDTIFGLSVDANEFDRLVALIESGARPEPVDIEAIVNHFAARPAPRRNEVELEVEGSREPLAGRVALLRLSIDTAGKRGAIVARDAELEVVLNRSAVLQHRLLGGGKELKATQGRLPGNSSATALVELRLKPGLSPREEIATVRIKYRDASGQRQIAVRTVRVAAVARDWNVSTRRHRITTLAALWGESLHEGTAGSDLARAAADLAAQDPADERARALAAAASASSRLRSSGPTGSGR